jgi:hypothetical protein
MPRWRWRILLLGTLISLCVYYLDYGRAFEDGVQQDTSVPALLMRLGGVLLIAGSLYPYRTRLSLPLLLVPLYALFGVSFLLGLGWSGDASEKMFLNTLLQLPVLVAMCQTRWSFDGARWLRFVATIIILQALGDLALYLLGQSLWTSYAFVGGFGNPSSYGVTCVVLLTFCLLHPRAGRLRVLKGVLLTAAALMSMSLFAILGMVVVYTVWMLRRMHRAGIVIAVLAVAGVGLSGWAATQDDDVFIIHKLTAAAAFFGLTQYDTNTSLSIEGRTKGHQRTWEAIGEGPVRFFTGHLEDKAYWPEDSQVLTYLGSFGALLLLAFLGLHVLWLTYAARTGATDGGFTLIALALFGAMLFTNRILDYFPLAILYFFCIAMAATRGWQQAMPPPAPPAGVSPVPGAG